MNKGVTADDKLADALADFYADPLGHVMFSYPWDSDPAIQVVDWDNTEMFVDPRTGFIYDAKPNSVETITYKESMKPYRDRFNCRYGPDKWACDWLDMIGREVRKRKFDGHKAVKPILTATASGHGIGKSTLVAWVIKWIMDTRPNSKGTVTANTAEQLRTKTWAELGKWHRRSMTEHWFQYNSGRGNMSLRRVGRENEWFCSAQTCKEENSESFAGQHAAAATSFYIFDEASAVPSKIYEVRAGGTVTGEPMVFDFGNPTRNSGEFYEEVEGRRAHRYKAKKIDSRTVAITNKSAISEWVEDYGEDSDFVKVRVRGEFPSSGSLQFVPTAWVRRAQYRELTRDRFASATLGVDVARFGDDDAVIYPVVGNDARTFAPIVGDGIYNGLDNVQLANKVIQKIQYFESLGVEVSAVFVDVGGTGSGVVDTLVHSGYSDIVYPVNFGNSPVGEPEVYRYRGDEMWGRGKNRLKTDLILPLPAEEMGPKASKRDRMLADTSTRLFADLTQREFGYTLSGNKISLETKRDMKRRGISSPDVGDGLFLNFAQDIPRMSVPQGTQRSVNMSDHDYDPLANVTVD